MGRGCLTLAALCAMASIAGAETWRGEITEARGRWADGGRTIVTDATLRTAAGERIAIEVLGGHVDGITMHVFHGPPRLAPGMRVTVDGAHLTVDDAGGAAPYVRSTGSMGVPLRWAKRCVLVTAATEGTSAVDDEAGALATARAAWAGTSCAYLELADAGTADHEVGLDGINLIKYRDVEWCRPASGGNPPRCHDPGAVAITTLFFIDRAGDPRNGEILDADIELNNVNYRLTIGGVGTGTQPCDGDIAATLTHELGHAMGFEHVCRGSDFDPPWVDHTGAPVPLCLGNDDPAITEATMYPFQDCGETKKVTPEADDLAALCGVYPTAADPGACAPPDPLMPVAVDAGADAALAPDDEAGGCCGAGASGAGVATVTLAVLALLWRPRRRRSSDTVGPCAPV